MAAVSRIWFTIRADVLELGARHGLLLGEFRESERGSAKCTLATGRSAGFASHGQLVVGMNNMNDLDEFTNRYVRLLGQYGLKGERTQVGHGNENGDIEQRHHRFWLCFWPGTDTRWRLDETVMCGCSRPAASITFLEIRG